MEICKCNEPIKWNDAFTESFLISMDKCSKCWVEEFWEEVEDDD